MPIRTPLPPFTVGNKIVIFKKQFVDVVFISLSAIQITATFKVQHIVIFSLEFMRKIYWKELFVLRILYLNWNFTKCINVVTSTMWLVH